jgi:hypothetical protein
LGPEFNLTWEYLLPAFTGAALPRDPAADRQLADRLTGLHLPGQPGQGSSPVAVAIAGKRFVFSGNNIGLESIALVPAKDGAGAMVECRLAGLDQRIVCGHGTWVKGFLTTQNNPPGLGDLAPIAACGAWTADDTYTAKIIRYRTPFTLLLRLRFFGDKIAVDLEQDLDFGESTPAHLVGKVLSPAETQ